MAEILLYIFTATIFLGVDAAWLKAFMKPMFDRAVPHLLAEDIRFGPAAGFYLLYIVGILYFASAAGLEGKGYGAVVLDAAVLGFMAYGTYEATNLSTLKGWTARMALIDVAWGTALTALSAVLGLALTLAITG